MSKQPSLLNFFKPLTPKSSPNVSKSADSSNSAKKTPKTPRVNQHDFEVCDVIWAKLDGYPWWPGLVCNDPRKQKHIIGNDLHVQFFDDPPTRSWVHKKKNAEKYDPKSDKKNPKACEGDDLEKLKKACKEADEAFQLSKEDRTKLLFDFTASPSDDEKKSSPGTDKENDDSISSSAPPSKKRKLFVFDSEDSEDEYKPEKVEESDDEELSEVDSNDEAMKTESEEEIVEEESPPRGVKRKRNQPAKSNKRTSAIKATPTSSPRPSACLGSNAKAKLSLFKNAPETPKSKDSFEDKTDDWPHLKYDFLKPDKIMDKKRRKADHPEYDKRTLYVPEDFKAKVTPGVRQWWELKSDHFDCVIFFKVGKFYEMYHMDAVVGVNELSLTMMKGEFAHSGFPEIAYGRFSNILVQKGYKVARVEQTETPDMMNERCKQQARVTKFDKVVKREICQVTTKGTQIFSFIDGEAKESETNYLLALTEKADSSNSVYGICFIDTSIGTFHIGQFSDDKYSSRLRTLLSHYPPVQILYERNHLSAKTLQLLKNYSSIMQEALAPETEFWTAGNTLKTLAEENHFENSEGIGWPDAIKHFISSSDSIGLTASDDGELALKSLGAVIWYLKNCFLDQQLIAMKRFEVYTPVDAVNSISPSEETDVKVDLGRYMVLDGITLTNLEVLANSNGGTAGSLLEKIDRCCTFSGKRLIRQWLCSPLCNISAIVSRQKAVSELLEKNHIVDEVRSALKSIPDLERLLGKIHTQGNAIRSKTHPDSRAIFFEDKIYSKRKILDFLSALNGFQKLQDAFEIFRSQATPTSKLLKQCILYPPEGRFSDLSEHLKFFEEAFDHELAKKEGTIIPKSSGVDVEYDNVMEELKSIEKESNTYLKSQCQKFGVQVKYFGSDKNRFQLEISDNQAKRTDSEYEFTSSRKGFKRYMTSKTREFLKRQMQAEETRSAVLKDLSRRVFAQFSDKYEEWNTAIQCMAMLDVLMSIAEYCRTEEGDMVLPEFEEPKSNSRPYFNIKNGRHPCISAGDNFIPNDTQLGTDEFTNLILLTGPNMGGKSTLMRQLGLITIMAHMGSLVPASSCKLVPVDRIFTRIGANDDILAGESTFFVELSETSLILNHATKFSLVLVDELGRGTSTYDGTAIAYSVVNELAARRSRTLFSTHYHTLVENFKNSQSVSLGHMACMVETDEDDPSEETVTFLYKFSKGACPKSYGFNAAKLAGVPLHIIKVGREKAELLEKENERRKMLRKLWDFKNISDLTLLLDSIKLVI